VNDPSPPAADEVVNGGIGAAAAVDAVVRGGSALVDVGCGFDVRAAVLEAFFFGALTADPIPPITMSAAITAAGMRNLLRLYHSLLRTGGNGESGAVAN
jgi:hypothetical protein